MSYNPNYTGSSTDVLSKITGAFVDNNSGGTLTKGTPVRIDSVGNLNIIDVSSEIESLAIVGVIFEDVLNTEQGRLICNGRLDDISGFTFGDSIYVSKTGTLTNTKPDIGVGGFVAGDFIIRIGVISKNEINPGQDDLLLNITITGQL